MDGPLVDRWTAMLRWVVTSSEHACWFDKSQRSICRSAMVASLSAIVAKTMAAPATFNFH
ncbi:hypothetical protein V1273_002183 [Bradyrhizobium sp. AZCC 1721]